MAPKLATKSAIAALLLAAACTRPLSGRELGPAMLSDLKVEPRFVREGVPITVGFRLPGGPVGDVTIELAGRSRACTAERLPDASFRCTLPALARTEYPQGPTELVVRARDQAGTMSEVRVQITLDFDCPELRRVVVEPPIGAPGAIALLTVESRELLRSPPTVSRAGRIWETATGTGTLFRVEHRVTADDPGMVSDIVVRAVDLAGNTTGDCGIDGRVPFAVDRGAPSVDPTRIELVRDVPGRPAVLSVARGALTDDVAVTELAVYDATAREGAAPLLVVTPNADGSIPPTPIDPAPRDRVRVEASDAAGKRSERLLVRERWRLSIGLGEAPNAAIRTAVRVTPAPPGSVSMENRTADFALAVRDQDTMAAVVTAEVGFKTVGRLPTEYGNVVRLAAGYDPANRAIVAFGGRLRQTATYKDQTVVLRWNEFTRSYEDQVLPRGASSPLARAGSQIAFDRTGCGLMFGGFDRDRFHRDLWRACASGNGYRWERLDLARGPSARLAPIAYDPRHDRWVLGFGTGPSSTSTRDLWLLDRAGTTALRWTRVLPLPSELDRTERGDVALWDDPGLGGQSFGLGYAIPFVRQADLWTWSGGRFTRASLTPALTNKTGYGYAFDVARRQLAVFGDDTEMVMELDRGTWLVPSPPSAGAPNGRRIDLEPRVPRGGVTMVYDSDREAVIVLGGARFYDLVSVAPDVEEMVTPPSWPMLQATIDLGLPRPDGIRALHLDLRGAGAGDADGTGPGTGEAAGYVVKLWDHGASRWVDVAAGDSTRLRAPVAVSVEVSDRPARFVSPEGVVPVTITARWPATEEVDARLEVDRIDGWLELGADVPRGPRVVSFAASPSAVLSGRTSTLAWSVRDASTIEIWSGGMRVFTSPEARGGFRVSPARTTIYELRALMGRDVGATATATVTVTGAANAPMILSFTSDRAARAKGGGLELTYEVERAANVRILRGSTLLQAVRAQGGEQSFTTTIPLGITGTSTTFRLEATGPGGTDAREIRIYFADPRVIGQGPLARFNGSISTAGEQDLYEVEVTSPGYISAAVFSPSAPSCVDGVDLYMTLFDANLRPIGTDDDDGEGACPLIDPFGDRFAAVLPGVYFLRVDEYGDDAPVAAYQLDVRVISQGCGNGRREGAEGCDDGNTTSGDGCSATCMVEALAAYRAPGSGRVVYSNAIALAGEVDTYRIDVSAPTFITAETFSPNAAMGCNDDVDLVLLASDMLTTIQEDDEDGVGPCALIDQALAPGTYFLQVHEYGDDATINAYQLVLDTPRPPLLEVEPNGTAPTATPLGMIARGTRTGTLAASIYPARDEDWYSFSLPAQSSLQIRTWTGPRDPTSCTRDDLIELYDATLTRLVSVDDTASSYCASLEDYPAPAGAYFLRVVSYDPTVPVDFYVLELEAR